MNERMASASSEVIVTSRPTTASHHQPICENFSAIVLGPMS
jgi:hypothetical protein